MSECFMREIIIAAAELQFSEVLPLQCLSVSRARLALPFLLRFANIANMFANMKLSQAPPNTIIIYAWMDIIPSC